jgi:hypothetical protein
LLARLKQIPSWFLPDNDRIFGVAATEGGRRVSAKRVVALPPPKTSISFHAVRLLPKSAAGAARP